MKQAFHKTPSG